HARDLGSPRRKETRGLRKVDHGARDEAGDTAVRETGNGVGLHDDHRRAPEEGGDDGRAGDVAAHTENGGRFTGKSQAEGRHHGEPGKGGELLGKANAVEAADADFAEFESSGGDKAAFHAAFGAYKEDVVPAVAEFARHGQGGNNVASGASSGHQETRIGI